MRNKQRHARQRGEEQELRDLNLELEETRARLHRAYNAFNLVSDPDLIEAWVYEIQASQAKYSYLIKRRKALGAPAVEESEVRT